MTTPQTITNKKENLIKRIRSWLNLKNLLCIGAGAAYPLSFAPFNYPILMLASLSLLITCWQRDSIAGAAKHGFLFGLVAFTGGCYWLYHSIVDIGHAPMLLGIIATLLLSAYCALYPAIVGATVRAIHFCFLRKNQDAKATPTTQISLLLIIPAVWVIAEFIRCHLFSGFAWLLVGYSQATSSLGAAAPFIGVYGISWICLIIATALSILYTCNKNITRIVASSFIIGILVLSTISMYQRFTSPLNTIAHNKNHNTKNPAIKNKLRVSLLQGNIPQSIKWDHKKLQDTIDIYDNLTQENWHSDLIVWPESSIPTFPYIVAEYLNEIYAEAKSNKSTVMIGMPTLDINNKYYNTLLMLGSYRGKYKKQHLVPFGEYFPFAWMNKLILRWLKIPMSNFTAGGSNQTPLKISNIQFAAFICYEITYPDQLRSSSKDSQILITITDDGWFGNSVAPAQHLQMAQLQARIAQKPLLFDSNGGITAFVSPQGNILHKLSTDRRGAITATVIPMQGETPLIRWGYTPFWIFVFLSLLAGILITYFCNRHRNNKI